MESRFGGGNGWRRGGALVALAAVVASGCVGATPTGSPSLSPGASPTATVSGPASAAPSPTGTISAVDLSIVPLAPSGPWKSIRWMAVPTTPLLAQATAEPDTSSVFHSAPAFNVAGWSGGFVSFTINNVSTQVQNEEETTTATSYSSDGVHWHAGNVVSQKTSGIDGIRGIFEGPAGLLAAEDSGACGDSWVEGLLTSKDGVTWQAVDTRKAFGNAVIWNVSGGSKGFVATDTTGTKAWTSRDGRTWQPVNLGTSVFARSRIDDGSAVSAGYVLGGSTQVTGARHCGATTVDPSAKPTPTPPLRMPAVWWSADGTSWVKAQLPGAKAAFLVQMSLCRLDDHTLMAVDLDAQPTKASAGWVSSDGRTWKTLAQSAGIDPYNYMTDGRHGIQLRQLDPSANDAYAGGRSLWSWTGSGLVAIVESGNKPPYDWQTEMAVGPTGLVVIDAGQLWLGLPSSN